MAPAALLKNLLMDEKVRYCCRKFLHILYICCLLFSSLLHVGMFPLLYSSLEIIPCSPILPHSLAGPGSDNFPTSQLWTVSSEQGSGIPILLGRSRWPHLGMFLITVTCLPEAQRSSSPSRSPSLEEQRPVDAELRTKEGNKTNQPANNKKEA